MAGILDSSKVNILQTYVGDPSKLFWGTNAQFLSQNYIAAQYIYLLRSQHIGPFEYEIPEHLKDKIIACAPVPNFTIDGGYCKHELFAEHFSHYVGQPIFAAIDTTLEKARAVAHSIPISYLEQDGHYQISLENFSDNDILYRRAETQESSKDAFADEENTTLEFTYQIPSRNNLPNCSYGTYAFMGNDGRLNLYITTDWPSHTHKHVAHCLGIEEEMILIYPLTQGRVINNLFIEPTLWACYVAIATWQTGKPCKLHFSMGDSYTSLAKSPHGTLNMLLAVNKLGEIQACRMDLILACGYYGYLVDEFVDQVHDAFSSLYSFPQTSLNVRAVKTSEMPCGPYLLTARAIIQFVLDNALGHIAQVYQIPDQDLRLKYLIPSKSFLSEKLSKLTDCVMKNADFSRKTFAYTLESKKTLEALFDEENTIYLPLRGVGLSCAAAQHGFLRQQYQRNCLSAEWFSADRLVVKINSYPHNMRLLSIWKKLIAERLKLDTESVEILCHSSVATGPYGMGSSIHKVSQMLPDLCDQLLEKLEDQGFPATCVLWYNDYELEHPKANYHDKRSLITCAVEILIDPIEFSIKITNLNFALYCGKVYDEYGLHSYFSTVLMHVIHWLYHRDAGIQRIWRSDSSIWPGFKLTIINDDTVETSPLSIAGLIESSLPGAFISAVSQALDTHITTFPIFPESIFKILKGTVEDKA